MLTAAAVCPHPPLLVPELAGGAAGECDDLRARCRAALAVVTASRPAVLYVVGADIGVHATSLGPWGADVPVDVPEPLPLALLVGAWLTTGHVRSFVVVAPDLPDPDCRDLGAELAASADRVGLLVMGDGSARHSIAAPGYLDPRAEPFDAQVAATFGAGDLRRLADVDRATADALLVAGAGPWQVLAGAAATHDASARTVATSYDAPYGVGYHVGAWTWP